MPRTIRFHLDEHVHGAIARGLRRHGMDVTTTPEMGFIGARDEVHLDHARQAKRLIVTFDQDFLRLHYQGEPHWGVAYCKQQSKPLGEIIRLLALIWDIYEPQEMQNRLEYL